MKWLSGLGMVAAGLAFVVAWTGIWGLAFMKVWEWFVQPMGLPALGFGNAFGVGLLFALVNESHGRGERDAVYVGGVVLRPVFVLAMGWLVKTIVG